MINDEEMPSESEEKPTFLNTGSKFSKKTLEIKNDQKLTDEKLIKAT